MNAAALSVAHRVSAAIERGAKALDRLRASAGVTAADIEHARAVLVETAAEIDIASDKLFEAIAEARS